MQRTTDLLSFWCCFVEHGTSQHMSERSVFVVLLHVFFGFLFAWGENISKQRHHCMGVSKNSGTPKWMVNNGNPYKMDDFGGKPTIFGNTHICVWFARYSLKETKKQLDDFWDVKNPTARGWRATSYIWGWGTPISCIIIPCFFFTP